MSSILPAYRLTCYDRQADKIKLIRTSSSQLDLKEEVYDYIFLAANAQDLHNVVKYRVIYMRQHEKIFSTMTKNLIVSLVCLLIFLKAC